MIGDSFIGGHTLRGADFDTFIPMPGSTRLQLTGAISHVLPIMISVMTSKWVGDAFGKDGIYAVWIAMRRYPWVPMADYHDKGETGALLMTPFSELVVIQDEAYTIAGISASLTCRDCLTCLLCNRGITSKAWLSWISGRPRAESGRLCRSHWVGTGLEYVLTSCSLSGPTN